MNRLILIGYLLLGSAPALSSEAWRPVQSDKWVPIPAAGNTQACRLVDETGSTLQGIWRVLDAGDTLRYEIRGKGTLRVETRAAVEPGKVGATYRIGIATAPDSVRKLARRSEEPSSVNLDCRGMSLNLLAADRWETDLVEGSEKISIFLRENRTYPVLVRVLARGQIERPGTVTPDEKTEVDWDFMIGTLGAGFTTNAYLAPTDSNSAETAFFLPGEVSLGSRIEPRKDFQLDFEYDFDGVFFRDRILNVYRHKLEAQQRWKNVSVGSAGQAQFELEQHVRTKQRTYFGRGYDEEAETAAGNPPAEDSYLADRFNWREYFLGADTSIEASETFDYGATIGYVFKDYVEDYADDPDTYSLDWSGVAAELHAEWHNDADLYAKIAFSGRDRRYKEKFSRDSNGTVVREVPSHLSYWPFDLEIGQDPRVGFRWETRARRLRIVDHYDGYWSRTYWRFLVEGTLAFRQGHRVRAHVGRSVTDFDRARVGNTPSGPIREKNVWLVGGKADFVLGQHVHAIVEIEYLDRNNNSRTFDYSLVAGRAGLNFEF